MWGWGKDNKPDHTDVRLHVLQNRVATIALNAEDASTTARNLAFLEKWRAGLRGVFSRLV